MRFTLLFLVALLCGCSAPRQNEADVPQAFQEGTVLTDIKRTSLRSEYGRDLVEALFAEEVERDTALARLVKDLDGEQRLHASGTRSYHQFDAHIKNYHSDAEQHYNAMQDTLLRSSIRTENMLALARYWKLTDGHREALAEYDSLYRREKDLLVLLKLRRTMPILEAYRDKNLPDKALLDRELDRVRKLEQRLNQQLGL
jgi:hypothetical protein